MVLVDGSVYPNEKPAENPRQRKKIGELSPIVMVVAVLSIPTTEIETLPVERLYTKEARAEASQPVNDCIELNSFALNSERSVKMV